jgi:hypothetical protein
MASNLSTIGFVFADEESFRSAMVECAKDASAQLDCAGGTYGIWRSRTGAEVWFHLGASEEGGTEIFGLTPFFEGQSDVALNISGPVAREGDNPFEGSLTGWVVPSGSAPDQSGDGSYPIVFDAVDYAAQGASIWPAIRHVRLAGFAREMQIFADEDAYYAARGAPDGQHVKLSAHAFIPIGLFAVAEDGEAVKSTQAPTSAALLTGKIIEHRIFTNEATGRDFVWMLVESLEATFDILADPAVIAGDVSDNATIEAAVWMFGRFLDQPVS